MVPRPARPFGPRPRAARRAAVPIVLALLTVAAVVPAAADAKTATGTVTVNAGYTLVARSTPSNDGAVVRQLKNGTKVTILCQTTGQKVTGRFGTSTLWDKLEGGGYVSDTYLYTGSDGRVASTCPAAPAPATPAPAPATPAPAPEEPVAAPPAPAPAAPAAGASVKLKDDYPFPRRSPQVADKWGFFHRECTSFVAWRVSRNVKGFENGMKGGRFGNAITWDDNARRLGYAVDRTPTKGAVMVRNSGRFGHVAVVAKVERRRFLVEQYNAAGHRHAYSKEWLTQTQVMRFIHFERKG